MQIRDDKLKDFLYGGHYPRGYPANLNKQLTRKLQILKAARSLEELRTPPSNRLERLQGNLDGYWSIRVNIQYRLIFKWDKETKEATDVYFDDYHR